MLEDLAFAFLKRQSRSDLGFNLGLLSKSHDKLRLNPKVKPGFSLSLLSDRLGLIGTVNKSNKKQCYKVNWDMNLVST